VHRHDNSGADSGALGRSSQQQATAAGVMASSEQHQHQQQQQLHQQQHAADQEDTRMHDDEQQQQQQQQQHYQQQQQQAAELHQQHQQQQQQQQSQHSLDAAAAASASAAASSLPPPPVPAVAVDPELVARVSAYRQSCLSILSQFQTHHLIPHSGKVVIFDSQLVVKHAFDAMLIHDLSCAPVWDSWKKKYVGLLSVSDFLDILSQSLSTSMQLHGNWQEQTSALRRVHCDRCAHVMCLLFCRALCLCAFCFCLQ
jgi:chemotaxis protein histidine kinase CheA